jgi:hypothetical protein
LLGLARVRRVLTNARRDRRSQGLDRRDRIPFGTIHPGRTDLAEAEGDALGKGSAAELLGNWRAAERDRVAAEETASVASLAAKAAQEAATAAEETAAAARLSLEAAQRAERAALRTSEAAELASRVARGESAAADAALEASKAAEDEAKARFQGGQSRGFRNYGA